MINFSIVLMFTSFLVVHATFISFSRSSNLSIFIILLHLSLQSAYLSSGHQFNKWSWSEFILQIHNLFFHFILFTSLPSIKFKIIGVWYISFRGCLYPVVSIILSTFCVLHSISLVIGRFRRVCIFVWLGFP